MTIVQNKALDYLDANFAETETIWNISHTYSYAQEIRDGHYIYTYAGTTGTNTLESPSVNNEKIDRVWVQTRPTNYFAMIDGKTNTQTQNVDSIDVLIACSNCDAISLLGLEAKSITLTLFDNLTAQAVHTKTIDLVNTRDIIDFSTYCFEEFNTNTTIYEQLPLYTDAGLIISIEHSGMVAKCGRLVVGRTYFVGETGVGANLGMESYSRKETDVFGNVILNHTSNVNIDSYEAYVPTRNIQAIRRKMAALDAIPVLFIMDESQNTELENLLTYGYFEVFNIMLPDTSISTASITIKGLL